MPENYTIFGHVFNSSLHTDRQVIIYPPPPMRGTYSIIFSCIVTLALCVWSAVHVNIPYTNSNGWRTRLFWLFWAIIVPEYVAVIAVLQNAAAGTFAKEVNGILGLRPKKHPFWRTLFRKKYRRVEDIEVKQDNGGVRSSAAWTVTHGFYAVMGGFVLDTMSAGPGFLPEDRRYVTLTPSGLRFIFTHYEKPESTITAAEIRDKSKADSFTKILACFQLIWFILQCIGRAVSKLPISLLEFNTIAHCSCALCIYCVWWHKPFDVKQATIIPVGDEKMRAIVAYMWMASKSSCKTGSDEKMKEFDSLKYTALPQLEPLEDLSWPVSVGRSRTSRFFRDPNQDPLWEGINDAGKAVMTYTGFAVNPQSKRFTKVVHSNSGMNSQTSYVSLPPEIVLKARDLQRWKLASQAIRDHGVPEPKDASPDDGDLLVLTADSSPNMKSAHLHPVGHILGLILALTMYGSVHALAWNYNFISPGEGFYWRASVILLLWPIIFLLVATIACLFFYMMQPLKEYTWLLVLLYLLALVPCAFVAFCGLLCLLSVPARFYVIVVAIKDVFYLPEQAMRVVPWTTYFPHLW